jgi:hypothetical protein
MPFWQSTDSAARASIFVRRAGRPYDSKAIVGAAFGYQHPERGPLQASALSGGEATVQAKLEALGFEVIVVTSPRAPRSTGRRP